MTQKKYEQLIRRELRDALEDALEMNQGYVLNFSDRSFNDFFYETIKLDPVESPNLFIGRGTSKAKKLRSFIENALPTLVAKVLRELWVYRANIPNKNPSLNEKTIEDKYFEIVSFFEGKDTGIDSSAIEAFEPNETMEELISAIKRDLDADKPQVALDRLHTYCMKRFAFLIHKHGGGDCKTTEALHARVGRYMKLLTVNQTLSEMSLLTIKSSISVFEKFNPIRNNKSLAHDNPELISRHEARFIFDSVTALLRFIKSIDSKHFEDS